MNNFGKKLLFSVLSFFLGTTLAFSQNTVKHIIDRGETLQSIAKRYSTTPERIIELNPDAAQFIYVGMELQIPATETSNSLSNNRDSSTNNLLVDGESNNYNANNESDFESQRKWGFVEVGYFASSFDDVKASGHYGVAWSILPWKIADRFYVGAYVSPFNFNYGLVPSDFTTDVIKFGPQIGYYFTPQIAVTLPVNVLCDVYFEGTDTSTLWGLEFAPTIYVGKKFGIYAGPLANVGFYSGSKFDFGFRAGLYF